MNSEKIEDIMKNIKELVIFAGTDDGDYEILLKLCKDNTGDIHLYGIWSGDIDDRMNDDDLFDIVSRTLAYRYDMGDEIKNVIIFPNGIPELE